MKSSLEKKENTIMINSDLAKLDSCFCKSFINALDKHYKISMCMKTVVSFL